MAMKIILAVVILLVIALVSVMIFFKVAVRSRDMVRKPIEQAYGTGERRALVLFQPSNHGGNVPITLAMAEALVEEGYTVTVNYPSELVPYDLEDYDALLFGTNVYVGETAQPLKKYLTSHKFSGKKVVLFVTGRLTEQPELETLKKLVPDGNEVHAIKVRPTEQQRLIDFVKESLCVTA